jgi:Domain of unknown function (DUF4173)
MSKSLASNLLVFIGTLLYNFIFWNEKMGVNTLIFTVFITGALYYLQQESFEMRAVQVTAVGTLLLAGLVVLHNSLIAKVMYMISLVIFVGLTQQREIRFLLYAMLLYIANLLQVPLNVMRAFKELPTWQRSFFKLLIVPLLVLPFFFVVYTIANPKFADFSFRFLTKIWKVVFVDWHWLRAFFCLSGLFLVGAALWEYTSKYIGKYDRSFDTNLHAENYSDESIHFKMLGMDANTSRQSAMILLLMLNAMLLFNNMLDVNYVWRADVSQLSSGELKNYVHEGTYVLIFGILMAIGVVMYLFKGALNFLPDSKIIKILAFAWLLQNVFLTLSVGVRNWQYIDYYGLAYKRVGVMVFLALVLYGLWLMYVKITARRTLFFFVTNGAWAIYAVLFAASCINWDVLITNYNLTVENKSHSIDILFLVQEVSDKNLPLLRANAPKLLKNMTFTEEYFNFSGYNRANNAQNKSPEEKNFYLLHSGMFRKQAIFKEEQTNLSWLSWNYPDFKTKEALENSPVLQF